MPPPLSDTVRDTVQYYFDIGETPQYYWEQTGFVYNLNPSKGGRPFALQHDHLTSLLTYLDGKPTAYLDELAWYLYDDYDIVVDESTIWRSLQRLGWSRKAVHKVAKERNARLRADWFLKLSRWDARQLCFLDESAANERTGDRKYAWAPVGSPCYNVQSFKRSKRWSILPAFTVDGYIAHRVHHGSITAEIFNDFVRSEVLPQCSSDGINVLVMDNAKIHRNIELQDMCDEADVELAFLPPYSPDYNPIEISFAILKAWIKRNIHLADAYGEEAGGFGQFLYDACQQIHKEHLTEGGHGDPGNLFRLAGIEYP